MKNVITSIFGFTCLISFAWSTNSTSAKSAESIKIGAVLPFSGGVELYGRQAKLGIDFAAREINAGGEILARPVEVVYEDDKTDPAVAVDATHGSIHGFKSSHYHIANSGLADSRELESLGNRFRSSRCRRQGGDAGYEFLVRRLRE